MRQAAKIAVSVEHVRAWGRRVCEGIAAFSHTREDWHLTLYEDGLPSPQELLRYDGFLWCVTEAAVAETLTRTGKPVVDLVNDGKYPGTISVGADHDACGALAARHLLNRHLRQFAYFGWQGLRFSDAREVAFRNEIEKAGYPVRSYLSRASGMGRFVSRNALRERLTLPTDAKAVDRWVRRLPKPIGVFCANDLRAWQLAQICRAAGLSVPKDVAILGADNDPVPCLFVTPSLSSVDTDTFETGRRAAEVLAGILDGTHAPTDSRILVPPRAVESRESTAIFPVEPPWLAAALTYIYENTARGLTASDVVATTGYSYATVENVFRTVLGSTIQREIISARLDRAEHLLRTSDLSISEIARRSGYGTIQYFSLAFAARHHQSPTAWRNR